MVLDSYQTVNLSKQNCFKLHSHSKPYTKEVSLTLVLLKVLLAYGSVRPDAF